MKKALSLLLAFLCLFAAASPAYAAEGLSNFLKWRTYTAYPDVDPSAWYAEGVRAAYEYSFISGDENGFDPEGSMTLAEVISIAARLHNSYHGGSYQFYQWGTEWYWTYVEYAFKQGIIPGNIRNVSSAATRSETAAIFASTLPAYVFPAINDVPDGTIPDVETSDAIYLLYRAGVLMGHDAYGFYHPDDPVQRCEVAAAAARIADPALRARFVLEDRSPPEEENADEGAAEDVSRAAGDETAEDGAREQ